jgi:hypothetical protein
MLMTDEEYADYAHIMTEESYKEHVIAKRANWSENPCIPARAKINCGNTKIGDLLPSRGGRYQARAALTESDGNPHSGRNQCCHLCTNDSNARYGFVCINPNHLYWGTYKDNKDDVSKEILSKVGRKAGLIGGNISANRQSTCPHCSKTGQTWGMSRWHFDNCKSKNVPA